MIATRDALLAQLARWQQLGNYREPAHDVLPRELHLELTYRCDARCRMCDVADLHRQFPGHEELAAAEILTLLERSPLLRRLQTVILSGGEPTLRDDLPELVAGLRTRRPGLSLGILTNGMHPERLRRQLAAIRERCGTQHLWLGSSLDGATAEVHDTVRGVPGAFAHLQESVRMVQAEFGLNLSLTFTITPHNLAEIAAAAALAETWGCWFGLQFVDQKTTTEQFRFQDRDWRTAEEQLGMFLDRIIAQEDAYTRINGPDPERYAGLWTRLHYLATLLPFGRDGRRRLHHCPAGERFVMLDPYGNLSFCPILKARRLGSVRGQRLEALWRAPAADTVRREISAGRCACWLLCTSIVTLDAIFRSPAPPLPLQPEPALAGTPPPDVSIVIPAKNEAATIDSTLAMLAAQLTTRTIETIVIDSGSTDDTPDIARRHGARLVSIRPEEFDHGGTRNLGAQLARGQYLVFLNADAVPERADWLEHLLAPLADPNVAGVYSRIVPGPGSDPVTCRELTGHPHYHAAAPVSARITDADAYRRMSPMHKRHFVAFESVSCAMPRALFLANPFRRICLGEDLEWGKRLLELGHILVYQPLAPVRHANNFYRSAGETFTRHRLDARCNAAILGRREVLNPLRMFVSWLRDLHADFCFLQATPGYSWTWYGWLPCIRLVARAGRLAGMADAKRHKEIA